MVKEVNDEELKALIASGKKIVCDFFASWCGPCRMLAPVMETLSEELGTQAEFVKTDTDKNPVVAIENGVASIPTVIIFEDGKVKALNVGFMPEEVMREYLKAHI